jgi:hypothetical protein
MDPKTPNSASDRLPASLFSIYQTYKRGTSIVIHWLTSRASNSSNAGKPSSSSDDEEKVPDPAISVRQIVDHARKASQEARKPPQHIQSAFKSVLLNRGKLIRHYEDLKSTSDATKESTERHEAFNEALAEAYSILFPATELTKRSNRNTQKVPAAPLKCPLAVSNTFDALTNTLERELDNGTPASTLWQEDAHARPTTNSGIAEDPIESSIALHAYFSELQAIVGIVETIWGSVAQGHVPVTVAAWLTNLAAQYVRCLSYPLGTDQWFTLEPSQIHLHKHREASLLQSDLPSSVAAGTNKARPEMPSLWLAQNSGLTWPFEELDTFKELLRSDNGLFQRAERRRF